MSLQQRATILQQMASQTSNQEVRQRLLMLAASFASAQILFNQYEAFHSVPVQPPFKTARHKALRNGMPMRDLVADWKRWTFAERSLAVMITLLGLATPIGILMSWSAGV